MEPRIWVMEYNAAMYPRWFGNRDMTQMEEPIVRISIRPVGRFNSAEVSLLNLSAR